MIEHNNISAKSKRVAKNTLLLYFRMLLLMFIGIFTSRVVLNTLGVNDYGTYQVVYSAVMMFTMLSNGIGSSISRFIAYELGIDDADRLRKVFSSAIFIQAGLCVLLFIVAETLGLWYLKNRINIPDGRNEAAMWVFQTSILSLTVQLMSVPFNSTIVAHEDMKAFAWVSLLEGSLKLGIAFALYLTASDRLIVYSVLMLVVALMIRGIYSLFCHKQYRETQGKFLLDFQLVKQMLSFGAWSFTANGVTVLNTQGVNLLSNSFFGVGINAVRGIAGQAGNIVSQFVINFITALNPLIIKTWAKGEKEYCFSLARKGCKFCFLIVLFFTVPFIYESDFILKIWLGNFPEGAPLFTTLAIICVMIEAMSNSLLQLIMANGKVGMYYSIISIISSLTFIGTYIAFQHGATPQTAYYISAIIFLLTAVVRLLFVKHLCVFNVRLFWTEVILPLSIVCIISLGITFIPYYFTPKESIPGSIICILTSLLSVLVSSFIFALTKGERQFLLSRLKKSSVLYSWWSNE